MWPLAPCQRAPCWVHAGWQASPSLPSRAQAVWCVQARARPSTPASPAAAKPAVRLVFTTGAPRLARGCVSQLLAALPCCGTTRRLVCRGVSRQAGSVLPLWQRGSSSRAAAGHWSTRRFGFSGSCYRGGGLLELRVAAGAAATWRWLGEPVAWLAALLAGRAAGGALSGFRALAGGLSCAPALNMGAPSSWPMMHFLYSSPAARQAGIGARL